MVERECSFINVYNCSQSPLCIVPKVSRRLKQEERIFPLPVFGLKQPAASCVLRASAQPQVAELPLVVSDGIQSLTKTKQAKEALKKLGCGEDWEIGIGGNSCSRGHSHDTSGKNFSSYGQMPVKFSLQRKTLSDRRVSQRTRWVFVDLDARVRSSRGPYCIFLEVFLAFPAAPGQELQKVIDSKSIRAGQGKARNRRYVKRLGPLAPRTGTGFMDMSWSTEFVILGHH